MSETRIYFTKTSDFCLDLRFGRDINGKWVRYCALDTSKDWKDITEKDCKNCKKARYLGITREQAIEKMATAIYEAMCPNFSQMFVGWRAYTKIAEAALNALLEPR